MGKNKKKKQLWFIPKQEKIEPGESRFQTMPKKIILKILSYLSIKDLGRCAQVSKIFSSFAYDQSLWQKISINSGPIPDGFIEQALTRGTKYLGLSPVNRCANPEANNYQNGIKCK